MPAEIPAEIRARVLALVARSSGTSLRARCEEARETISNEGFPLSLRSIQRSTFPFLLASVFIARLFDEEDASSSDESSSSSSESVAGSSCLITVGGKLLEPSSSLSTVRSMRGACSSCGSVASCER